MGNNNLKLADKNFGPILEYVKDNLITEINYCNGILWLDHVKKGRYIVENSGVTGDWINQFVQKLSSKMNAQCDKLHPYLEAESDALRISVILEDVTNTGYAISIKKLDSMCKWIYKDIIENGFCNEKMDAFLSNAVKSHLNIIVCGLPGSGKTTFMKYLTKYIPSYEKATIIESNSEIRYSGINPGKDYIERKINDEMDYADAVKLSMKDLSKWLIIDEIKDRNVTELLKSLSTGISCLTSINGNDVRKIPERIKNMNPTDININDVYKLVDVVVNVKSVVKKNQEIKFYISQLALLNHDVDTCENKIIMLYDTEMNEELPPYMKMKFDEAGVSNPLQYH